mmetsp:Transcript_11079/g.18552  ORF Transcript_11079/g.18552 Transcript_11079/m.18552 type:complete len:129 (+) Transcript_11079:1243-1629(+)
MYGDRCQFLHSIYDLKRPLTYAEGLKEGARLTLQRYEQMCIGQVEGAEILWANLVTGKGCGAPERRLECFEMIYNKESYIENKRKQCEKEKTSKQFNQAVQPFVPTKAYQIHSSQDWQRQTFPRKMAE